MRRTAIVIIILSLLWTITAVLAVPVITQGDDVYLGENVDISLAISWPDYTVAWCSASNYGCNPPDQIIEITGFMHNYYIDPAVFHPGWYYRWNGQWNRGENQDAFRVRTGTRPVVNTTPTIAPTPTPAPGVDARGNGPFTWLVARGDSPDITFRYNTTDICGTGLGNDKAHVWLFGGTTMVTDKELRTQTDDYFYEMTAADTASLETGKYTGYIQFPGVNGRQDVFYDPVARCLDTPYDDSVYPDVAVDTRFPASFRTAFEEIARSTKYSDDLLVPITMTVVEPSIRITDIEQGEDNLYIAGTTSWSNGTVITLRLDPDNYALASDKRKHTWTVKAEGDILSERLFSTTVPINMEDMYIGTHELKMSVDKNNYVSDVYHNFKITGTYVMPTQTPELKKIITDMDGTPISPVETTRVVPVYNVTYTQTIPTTVPTTELTPEPTTVPTTLPLPIKTTPNITLPLNPIMGLLAVCVAWGIVCRR